MTFIIISIIILGLYGILKTKFPKLNGAPGFAAEIKLFFANYILLILGIIFLFFEIKKKLVNSGNTPPAGTSIILVQINKPDGANL